jgi:hypothetical protein
MTAPSLFSKKNLGFLRHPQQIIADGIHHQLAHGVEIELAHNIRAVSFGGLYTDSEQS